ncbi:pilus assembly protein N-terminal domain-containing protein [Enterovirga rhinocerotis]|uniref:Putative type II/III system pilus formation protein n=1 Tax=Enterovirga rhinocerotis TaxID=1339210 RepID=A0A4R7CB91_9HYPH|nr:pilus assembly protein N-terminal domain-containing protein [Enterovirga rhinocerotis]TDR94695.1 putative type II/III system pilus formation protein [Enterovirga rhinocerotis]
MGSTPPFALTAALASVLLAAVPASARDAVRQVPSVSAPPASQPTPSPEPTVASAPVTTPVPAAASNPSSDRGSLDVMINRAKVIRLPERTQTVIVGNPAIADLSVQKSGIVVVTGKSYGSTNLIALDGTGNMLAESLVNVVGQTDGMLVVQRAFDRASYSCNPVCQPTVNLGDSNAYFNDTRAQADANNQFAISR